METKLIRIRKEDFRNLQELAELIKQDRGLRTTHLGIAAEVAISEALKSRKEPATKQTKKKVTCEQ